MSLDVITFEKSLQQRLAEYMDILHSQEKTVTASQVRKEWCCYAEFTLEPRRWQALWKISRLKCVDLGIQFPTIVFVEVENVDINCLTALVRILAVQDDIHLPEHCQVPLIHLYPTIHQENKIEVNDTAECLDQLRYFYNNVWQPWDDDGDTADNEDWITKHLEARIMLFSDIKSGIWNRKTGDNILFLLRKAREMQQTIESVNESMGDSDKSQECAVLEMQVQLDHIKNQVELSENPFFRTVILQKKLQLSSVEEHQLQTEQICLVWLGGSLESFLQSVKRAKSLMNSEAGVKSCSSLNAAFDQAIPGETILLCPGTHKIKENCILYDDGTVKGFPTGRSMVVCNGMSAALLDWSGACLTLEMLTLSGQDVRTIAVVRCGMLRLKCCNLLGTPESPCQGLLVLNGASVELQDCCVSGLESAVVANPGAQVLLSNCTINNCGIGIQIWEGASLSIEECTITDCSEFGITMQTTGIDQQKVGSLDLLASFKNVYIKTTELQGNTKGNVFLHKQVNNFSQELGNIVLH